VVQHRISELRGICGGRTKHAAVAEAMWPRREHGGTGDARRRHHELLMINAPFLAELISPSVS
jgi:hypothetical protein